MKYLLILLLLVGCTSPPLYQIGDKVRAGKCVGFIAHIARWPWPYENTYLLVPVKCGPIYYDKNIVNESEINKVL